MLPEALTERSPAEESVPLPGADPPAAQAGLHGDGRPRVFVEESRQEFRVVGIFRPEEDGSLGIQRTHGVFLFPKSIPMSQAADCPAYRLPYCSPSAVSH